MKNKSRLDVIMETSSVTGKWGVTCLVLGIITAAVGVMIGTVQIICGAVLMKKKKELSDVA